MGGSSFGSKIFGKMTSTPTFGGFGLGGKSAPCSKDTHVWVANGCKTCTQCGECTGFGRACPESKPDGKTPIIVFDASGNGMQCECMAPTGHSGCVNCGICWRCHNREAAKGDDAKKVKSDDSAKAFNADAATIEEDLVPTGQVIGLTECSTAHSVVELKAGAEHVVALLSDGTLLTMGRNLYGQLGCGDITHQPDPTRITLPDGERGVQIAAGQFHTVVRTASGKVFTFGCNTDGQVGFFRCVHVCILGHQILRPTLKKPNVFSFL